MIDVHIFENRKMINSLELYYALGRDEKKYFYWLKRFIERNASLENPRDYFLFRKMIKGRTGNKKQYYISITLAKSICIHEGTILAKKIRYHIEDHIEHPTLLSRNGK